MFWLKCFLIFLFPHIHLNCAFVWTRKILWASLRASGVLHSQNLMDHKNTILLSAIDFVITKIQFRIKSIRCIEGSKFLSRRSEPLKIKSILSFHSNFCSFSDVCEESKIYILLPIKKNLMVLIDILETKAVPWKIMRKWRMLLFSPLHAEVQRF